LGIFHYSSKEAPEKIVVAGDNVVNVEMNLDLAFILHMALYREQNHFKNPPLSYRQNVEKHI
jgi:hypothetical protein